LHAAAKLVHLLKLYVDHLGTLRYKAQNYRMLKWLIFVNPETEYQEKPGDCQTERGTFGCKALEPSVLMLVENVRLSSN